MSHFLHRTAPKPTVAGVSATPKTQMIERHLGLTREPRPRALKPPTG